MSVPRSKYVTPTACSLQVPGRENAQAPDLSQPRHEPDASFAVQGRRVLHDSTHGWINPTGGMVCGPRKSIQQKERKPTNRGTFEAKIPSPLVYACQLTDRHTRTAYIVHAHLRLASGLDRPRCVSCFSVSLFSLACVCLSVFLSSTSLFSDEHDLYFFPFPHVLFLHVIVALACATIEVLSGEASIASIRPDSPRQTGTGCLVCERT